MPYAISMVCPVHHFRRLVLGTFHGLLHGTDLRDLARQILTLDLQVGLVLEEADL